MSEKGNAEGAQMHRNINKQWYNSQTGMRFCFKMSDSLHQDNSVCSFMLTVGVTQRRLLGGHVVKGQNVRVQGGVLTGAVVQAQVILSEMLH